MKTTEKVRPYRRILVPLGLFAAVGTLAACGGSATPAETVTVSASEAPSSETTAEPTAQPTTESSEPSAAPESSAPPSEEAAVEPSLPESCESILTADLQTEFDEAGIDTMSENATESGGLSCGWNPEGADTTGIATTIEFVDMPEGLEQYGLDGYDCGTDDAGGIRCQKEWQNENYPVTDGETVYYRDGVFIDTTYSNFAPMGYTDAVIAAVWK